MSVPLRVFVCFPWVPDNATGDGGPSRKKAASNTPQVASEGDALSDTILLQQLQAQDESLAAEAFSTLFLRHTPIMFVAARRGACAGDIAHADDAVQSVMIRLWDRRLRLPIITDVRGYLIRAVAHECSNRRRSAARATIREAQSDDGVMVNIDTSNTNTLLVDEELASALHRAIRALPGRMGVLFRAWYASGASYEVVAAKFGVAAQAVARARLRAIAHLRTDPTLARLWHDAKE